LGLVVCGAVLVPICRGAWPEMGACLGLLCDRERVHALVTTSGWAAPLILIGLHVSQVLFAPVPGDAFCMLGGYLFGAFNGFLLSTIGMTIGSMINFCAGRCLGSRLVRRLVSAKIYDKYNTLVNRPGE